VSLDARGRQESAPKFYCPDWKETVQSVVSEGDVVGVLARTDSVAAKYGTCGNGGRFELYSAYPIRVSAVPASTVATR
jgi:hypothetical protein